MTTSINEARIGGLQQNGGGGGGGGGGGAVFWCR